VELDLPLLAAFLVLHSGALLVSDMKDRRRQEVLTGKNDITSSDKFTLDIQLRDRRPVTEISLLRHITAEGTNLYSLIPSLNS